MARSSRMVSLADGCKVIRAWFLLGLSVMVTGGAVLLISLQYEVQQTISLDTHTFAWTIGSEWLPLIEHALETSVRHPVMSVAVRVAVVPHHQIAAEATSAGIATLASQFPKANTVVILTPDHYRMCPTGFCTTSGQFETPLGTLQASNSAVVELLQYAKVSERSELFHNEHGIHALTPYVRYYFPHAQIVPLAVTIQSIGTPDARAELRGILLEQMRAEGTVLLVSSDFSHYLSKDEADALDADTWSTLCANESDALLALEMPAQTDCPLCLWLGAEVVRDMHSAVSPLLVWHSNSATLLKAQYMQETTSHMTVLWVSEKSSAHDRLGCEDQFEEIQKQKQ